MTDRRHLSLVGFMQASNVTVYSGAWRHPAADPTFLTAGYYQRIGQVLERGCFDMVFFDDRLAMPGIYGDSVAETIRTGARCVKLDLSLVLFADPGEDGSQSRPSSIQRKVQEMRELVEWLLHREQ